MLNIYLREEKFKTKFCVSV